jgi:hypothetical protein
VILYPSGQCDAYVEGAFVRKDTLVRENPRPRAVLNAVERLVRGYRAECEDSQSLLTIAKEQLKDYEARIGVPFAHAEYES